MAEVRVGTDAGCRVFHDGAESELELSGIADPDRTHVENHRKAKD